MNTVNPFIIYAMVAIIIAAGFLFIKLFTEAPAPTPPRKAVAGALG